MYSFWAIEEVFCSVVGQHMQIRELRQGNYVHYSLSEETSQHNNITGNFFKAGESYPKLDFHLQIKLAQYP